MKQKIYSLLLCGLLMVGAQDLSRAGWEGGEGITKDQYSRLLGLFHKATDSWAQKRGKRLLIRTFWEQSLDFDPTVTSYENRPGEMAARLGGACSDRNTDEETLGILITGGLVRHPEMTADGVLFVLCHELGHDLTTRHGATGTPWFEGIADYFAGSRCLPAVFRLSDSYNGNNLDFRTLPPEVTEACEAKYENFRSAELCKRLQLVALSSARYTFAWFVRYSPTEKLRRLTPPSFRAQSQGSWDIPQCRLEIVRAAALRQPLPRCARQATRY